MSGPTMPSNVCQQCGLSHPPLPAGAKCPMVKQATVDGEDIDYGNFLANMQNIVASQVEIKKIRKPKEMFAKLIVEFMKLVENYEEKEDVNNNE
ncbi:hypothetical protein KKF82_06615 [Patescibacteria group bacterium]|nr:hypothetical protein [Patescibacteria group bacterium]